MKILKYRNLCVGEMIPRFYLPVENDALRRKINCYFFLIAPVVLFYKIIKHIFYIIWNDLLDFLALLKYNIGCKNKIKGCNTCGSKMIYIRGRYPKDKARKICPTCAYEKLEFINQKNNIDYEKTYVDIANKILNKMDNMGHEKIVPNNGD